MSSNLFWVPSRFKELLHFREDKLTPEPDEAVVNSINEPIMTFRQYVNFLTKCPKENIECAVSLEANQIPTAIRPKSKTFDSEYFLSLSRNLPDHLRKKAHMTFTLSHGRWLLPAQSSFWWNQARHFIWGKYLISYSLKLSSYKLKWFWSLKVRHLPNLT